MKGNQSIALQALLISIAYGLNKALGSVPVTVVFMLAATAAAGAPVLRKAIAAARYRIIGIDALVTIAVAGALAIGEYWEAAAVTFLFSSLATTDYAEAAETSELCMIDGERLKQLMGEHPSVAFKVMEELSKRLEDAESLIEGINLRTVEQRLARFLIAESAGAKEVSLGISKGDLASRLGMSRETLSRKLAAFQGQGLIELRGQREIAILDGAALEDISEGEED